jgi:hypothetical protein
MSDSAINTESDDCDNEVLLPISSLFPPNEIISKKYAPDVKPTFRLMYLLPHAAHHKKSRSEK